MSWNGFPANVRFSIIRKLKAKYEVNSSADCNKHNLSEIPSQNDSSVDTRPKIWLRIPFMGKQGEFLVKNFLRKYSGISRSRLNLLLSMTLRKYHTAKLRFLY